MNYTQEIHAGCGGTIVSGYYATCPPIPYKECQKCGKKVEGERPKIIQKEISLDEF